MPGKVLIVSIPLNNSTNTPCLFCVSLRPDDEDLFKKGKTIKLKISNITMIIAGTAAIAPPKVHNTNKNKKVNGISAKVTNVADEIKKDNISCSVLDLRTLSPLDEDSILEAVEETGRVVIVDESSPRCNVATDISALISDKAFSSLKAPVKMITPPHTPVPFSPALEDLYLPSADNIKKTISNILN